MPRIRIESDIPKNLRPFISYYGGKYRAAPKYPPPRYGKIKESHAGSAGYSVRYPDRMVELYDVNPKVVGTWDYLIKSSNREILALPDLMDGQTVNDLDICQEARWLIGWWLNKASAGPRNRPSAWMRSGTCPHSYWGQTIRNILARQVSAIRHWKVFLSSYENIPNDDATWFVDPPYQGAAGRLYPFSDIDYPQLGEWCKSRRGQVIVCESVGADWLPFDPFIVAKTNPSSRGKSNCHEAIWTNNQPQKSTTVPTSAE
jgi:hypothetical protein